jgi:hypothetical protein
MCVTFVIPQMEYYHESRVPHEPITTKSIAYTLLEPGSPISDYGGGAG